MYMRILYIYRQITSIYINEQDEKLVVEIGEKSLAMPQDRYHQSLDHNYS